jgi:hypothetical protein
MQLTNSQHIEQILGDQKNKEAQWQKETGEMNPHMSNPHNSVIVTHMCMYNGFVRHFKPV